MTRVQRRWSILAFALVLLLCVSWWRCRQRGGSVVSASIAIQRDAASALSVHTNRALVVRYRIVMPNGASSEGVPVTFTSLDPQRAILANDRAVADEAGFVVTRVVAGRDRGIVRISVQTESADPLYDTLTIY